MPVFCGLDVHDVALTDLLQLGATADRLMHDLVGELATRSEDFRRRWSGHDVRLHGAGTKTFHHTGVGELEFAYESVDMVSDPGLSLTIYAAEPATRTAEALTLLGSLTATPVPAAVNPAMPGHRHRG